MTPDESCAARARRLLESGDVPGAIAAVDEALRLAPRRAEWLRLSGCCRTGYRDFDGARRDLDAALALDPSAPEGWLWQSNLRLVQGDFAVALESLERQAALGEPLPQYAFRRGLLLARTGRVEEAAALAAGLREKEPAWASLLDCWLAVYARDWTKAAAAAARAQAQASDAFSDHDRLPLTRALVEAGRFAAEQDREDAMNLSECSTADKGRLFFMGLGVDPPWTITFDVLRAVERCDVLFVNMASDRVMELLAAVCRGEMRAINYRTEEVRERCADEVMATLGPGRTVGYVTVGHVMVFGPLTRSLMTRCKAAGVRTRAWPGISILDAVLAGTGNILGEAWGGFQVHDVRALLARDFRLYPKVPAVFYLSNLVADRVEPLYAKVQEVLLRHYPPEHLAYVWRPGAPQRPLEELRLDALAKKAPGFDSSSQLFVPPLPGGLEPDRYDDEVEKLEAPRPSTRGKRPPKPR